MSVSAPATLPDLLTPAHLAHGQHYYLFSTGGRAFAEQVRSLLKTTASTACCRGIGRCPPPDALVILFEPDAVRQVELLEQRDPDAVTRARLLPIPTDYPWAFWAVWSWYEASPHLLEDLTSFDAFAHAFRVCPYLAQGPDGREPIGWNTHAASSLYWQEQRAHFDRHHVEIEQVRDRLADAASRSLYDMALRSDPRELWRHFIRWVFSGIDYLDHARPAAGQDVLNLGVFSGHEIPYFVSCVAPGGVVHCVDPLGFDLLSDYTREVVRCCADRVREARFAAGAAEGQHRFRRYFDGQARLDDPPSGARQPFRVQSMDDYVATNRLDGVGFVKIDIEGMERAALDGLTMTLALHRPTVSLAIYHSAEDMWRLPLDLMNQLPDYAFHISHASPVRWETTLTAVPLERQHGR